MTPEQTRQLVGLLSRKRAEAGLSVNEVARRALVDPGTVWRIEQGSIPTPRAESLTAIGGVLGIPAVDLFATVGWIPSRELPSFGPYLRAKYPQLPDGALREIEAYFEAVAGKWGIVGIDAGESPLGAASTSSDALDLPLKEASQ
ncbi:helix-turn-helix transcriptional regulator [Mycobacterium palustre]|nr:helix-turn-helix transcriptional regulator [Mycobacterium palustre]